MKKLILGLLGLALFGYGFFLFHGGKEELALSPGLMPMFLGILTMILSFFYKEEWTKKPFPLRRGAFILIYLVLWNLVGFWVSTLVFCFLGFYILAEKKLPYAALYSLGLTLILDLVFIRFFRIMLP